jgi:flagellar motility protein MotE (MotC chaperone)
MKKMHIIMIAAAGLLSFGMVFGAGLFIKKNRAAAAPTQTETAPPAASRDETKTSDGILAGLNSATLTEELGMSETQLKNLIFDIRQKMKEYENNQKQIDQEKQQVEIARQTLQEEVERLNQLQEKLNLSLMTLKDKESALQKSVLEIETVEKVNLQRIAGTYDKMDPAQAGKILSTMASNNQMQDAVKIMYYMSERIAGKVLGEIGAGSPEAAAALSLQLKRIKEQ